MVCALSLLALIPVAALAYAAIGWITLEWPYLAAPIALIVAVPTLAVGAYAGGRAAVAGNLSSLWLGITMLLLSFVLIAVAAQWVGRMLL
ncbi:hypothetical protein [Sphingomonas sp.]